MNTLNYNFSILSFQRRLETSPKIKNYFLRMLFINIVYTIVQVNILHWIPAFAGMTNAKKVDIIK